MSSPSAWLPHLALCVRNACVFPHETRFCVFFSPPYSRNSKLELELAQVRADFERLKSQDSTKSERLEELS